MFIPAVSRLPTNSGPATLTLQPAGLAILDHYNTCTDRLTHSTSTHIGTQPTTSRPRAHSGQCLVSLCTHVTTGPPSSVDAINLTRPCHSRHSPVNRYHWVESKTEHERGIIHVSVRYTAAVINLWSKLTSSVFAAAQRGVLFHLCRHYSALYRIDLHTIHRRQITGRRSRVITAVLSVMTGPVLLAHYNSTLPARLTRSTAP